MTAIFAELSAQRIVSTTVPPVSAAGKAVLWSFYRSGRDKRRQRRRSGFQPDFFVTAYDYRFSVRPWRKAAAAISPDEEFSVA